MKISKEIKVGVFAAIALTIVCLGFAFFRGKPIFSSNHIYYTTYRNCAGLSTASPVLLNGVPVGRVCGIKILPEQQYSALVTFEIQKNIQLTDATKTQLITPNLLGAKAVELLVEAGAPLENRAMVPGKVESNFMNFLAADTLPAMKSAQNTALVVGQLSAKLADNIGKIDSIFTNLEDVTHKLQQTVYGNQQDIQATSKKIAEIVGVLANTEHGIGPLLQKFNQILEGITRSEIQDIVVKLQSIVCHIDRVLVETVQEDNDLSKLLKESSLYGHLNKTLLDIDKLIVDFHAHPWKYVNISLFGARRNRVVPKKE